MARKKSNKGSSKSNVAETKVEGNEDASKAQDAPATLEPTSAPEVKAEDAPSTPEVKAEPAPVTPAAKATRDPARTHFASFAPAAPVKKWPRDGSKTATCFDLLLSTVEGVTVADLSATLATFGAGSRADMAYSRTWAAPSYLRPYGVGVLAKHDSDGLVRLYGVRQHGNGTYTVAPGCTPEMLAAVNVVIPQEGGEDKAAA